MDASRMSQGQMVAGLGGVLLIIFLFLPWIGDGRSLNGWELEDTLDIYLLITAVMAIAAAVGFGGGAGMAMPGVTMSGAAGLLGAVGTLLMLWLVIFDWPDGAGRKIGVFLSLIAVAMVAFGGYAAAQEEDGGGRPY
jgi:hypothetical protein